MSDLYQVNSELILNSCRQPKEPSSMYSSLLPVLMLTLQAILRCTHLKSFKKNSPPHACNLGYCFKDLEIKYGINARLVQSLGRPTNQEDMEGHDPAAQYIFMCPVCKGDCDCSNCKSNFPHASLG